MTQIDPPPPADPVAQKTLDLQAALDKAGITTAEQLDAVIAAVSSQTLAEQLEEIESVAAQGEKFFEFVRGPGLDPARAAAKAGTAIPAHDLATLLPAFLKQ